MFINRMISRGYKFYGLSQKLIISLKLRDYLEPYLLKSLLLGKYLRILKQSDLKRLCLGYVLGQNPQLVRKKYHKQLEKFIDDLTLQGFQSIDNNDRHAIGGL